MPRIIFGGWGAVIWGGPILLAVLASIVLGWVLTGSPLGLLGVGVGLSLLWLGICIYGGTVVLEQQQFAVIERIGQYHTVLFRGWSIIVIGVDAIRIKDDMRAEEYELYADERDTDIDFTDGVSARVVVKIWYRIGNQQHAMPGNEDWDALTNAIKLWAYAYREPEMRVFALLDGELRPRLQAISSDDAAVGRNGIADDAIQAVTPALEAIGAYPPHDHKLIIIEDIALKPEDVALRRQALEGIKRAEEQANEAEGYPRAILAIRDRLHVSTAEATRIYETQRGLDTLKEVKPAMTLVGENLKNVLGTINLGGTRNAS